MQVQIHFKDARNKRVDVLHPIKLDWTQTGLQTFGGETNVQAKLILKPADYVIGETKTNPTSTNAQVQPSVSESNVNYSKSVTIFPAVDNSMSVAVQTQIPANADKSLNKSLDLSLPPETDSKSCLTVETPKTDQTATCHVSTSSSPIPDDKPTLNRSIPDDCSSASRYNI